MYIFLINSIVSNVTVNLKNIKTIVLSDDFLDFPALRSGSGSAHFYWIRILGSKKSLDTAPDLDPDLDPGPEH